MPEHNQHTPACYFCLRQDFPKEHYVHVQTRNGEDSFLCCPECAGKAHKHQAQFDSIVATYTGAEMVQKVRELFGITL